jgi:hypothetical protein
VKEVIRYYMCFNAEGRELTLRMTAPPPASAAAGVPARYLANSADEMFEYTLCDIHYGDMVGISISNEDKQQVRHIGLSFRRRDQICRDVPLSVFEKVTNVTLPGSSYSHVSRTFARDAGGLWQERGEVTRMFPVCDGLS